MNIVYILLGGNQGNVGNSLSRAIALINQKAGRIISCSAIYQSVPWGFEAEQEFLNQVVCIKTRLRADDLLDVLLNIEKLMGRQRNGNGYSSRPIDIDILFFNDKIIETEKLIVPHPRLHLRNFALTPLMDISPGFVHPLLKKTIKQLKDSCPDTLAVNVLKNARLAGTCKELNE